MKELIFDAPQSHISFGGKEYRLLEAPHCDVRCDGAPLEPRAQAVDEAGVPVEIWWYIIDETEELTVENINGVLVLEEKL